MTQLEYAREGKVTPEMTAVAANENLDKAGLSAAVAAGLVVIPANRNHGRLRPIGIGKGLRTKVNANIGTSGDFPLLEGETRKMQAVLECGCDTVMDLSTGGRHHRRAPRPAGAGHHPLRQRADLRDDGRRAAAGAIVRLPGRGTDARLCPPPGRGRRRFHDHPRRPDPAGHRKTEGTAAPGGHRFPRRLDADRLDAAQQKREPVLRTLRRAAGDRPRVRCHPLPGRRAAAGGACRRQRLGPAGGTAHAGRTGPARAPRRRAGHGRGPRPPAHPAGRR